MGRKGRYTPFTETQSNADIDKRKQGNEHHIRLTKAMIYSPAYRALNRNELLLYQYMRLKFYKDDLNKEDFAFATSMGTKLLQISDNSEKVIREALKNLVAFGFLDRTYISKGGGNANKIPNRFKFSSRWGNLKNIDITLIKQNQKEKKQNL